MFFSCLWFKLLFYLSIHSLSFYISLLVTDFTTCLVLFCNLSGTNAVADIQPRGSNCEAILCLNGTVVWKITGHSETFILYQYEERGAAPWFHKNTYRNDEFYIYAVDWLLLASIMQPGCRLGGDGCANPSIGNCWVVTLQYVVCHWKAKFWDTEK